SAISVVWSRPAIVAGRTAPSESLIATSPSSASISSAVMTRPGFQTKPVARERRERTETIDGAALAATPASADEREARIVAVGSDMGNLQSGLDPIWGFSIARGTGRVGSFVWMARALFPAHGR